MEGKEICKLLGIEQREESKELKELREKLEKSIYEALKSIPQESPEESRARHRRMIKEFLDKVLEANLTNLQ